MPAWNEARRLSSAMSSTAAKKDDAIDDNPAVDMLRDWFRRTDYDEIKTTFEGAE